MKDVIFVTGNMHKATMLSSLLGRTLSHKSLELEEIQSVNLQSIAEHKAKQAYDALHQPVLVDDTSLGFTALSGLPGPFIKYFEQSAGGLEMVCRMLDGFSDRTATAKAVIAYYDGRQTTFFGGMISGTIAVHPRGKNGHGWDAIFCPNGFDGQTRAELDETTYAEVYKQLRPVTELKMFLDSLPA